MSEWIQVSVDSLAQGPIMTLMFAVLGLCGLNFYIRKALSIPTTEAPPQPEAPAGPTAEFTHLEDALYARLGAWIIIRLKSESPMVSYTGRLMQFHAEGFTLELLDGRSVIFNIPPADIQLVSDAHPPQAQQQADSNLAALLAGDLGSRH